MAPRHFYSSSGRSVRAASSAHHPDLEALDDGDLKFHTDFRQVYASLLQSWLGIPSEPIVGAGFYPARPLSCGRYPTTS